jgi:hypothetical protein
LILLEVVHVDAVWKVADAVVDGVVTKLDCEVSTVEMMEHRRERDCSDGAIGYAARSFAVVRETSNARLEFGRASFDNGRRIAEEFRIEFFVRLGFDSGDSVAEILSEDVDGLRIAFCGEVDEDFVACVLGTLEENLKCRLGGVGFENVRVALTNVLGEFEGDLDGRLADAEKGSGLALAPLLGVRCAVKAVRVVDFVNRERTFFPIRSETFDVFFCFETSEMSGVESFEIDNRDFGPFENVPHRTEPAFAADEFTVLIDDGRLEQAFVLDRLGELVEITEVGANTVFDDDGFRRDTVVGTDSVRHGER